MKIRVNKIPLLILVFILMITVFLLGGNENFLRQFISGMAIPNEHIQEFLKEWNK